MVTHFSGRLDELKIPQADLQRRNNRIVSAEYVTTSLRNGIFQGTRFPTHVQTYLGVVLESLPKTESAMSLVMQHVWQQLSSCKVKKFLVRRNDELAYDNSYFRIQQQGWSEGRAISIVFMCLSMTYSSLPVWRHVLTGESLGSLVQICKGHHSHSNKIGRGKD